MLTDHAERRWNSNVCYRDRRTNSDLLAEQGASSWSRSKYTFIDSAVNQKLFPSKFVYNKIKNFILTSKETHSIIVSLTKFSRSITVPIRTENTTEWLHEKCIVSWHTITTALYLLLSGWKEYIEDNLFSVISDNACIYIQSTIFVLNLFKEVFCYGCNAIVRNEFYCCKTRLLEAKIRG
jgi:hypothetical protein